MYLQSHVGSDLSISYPGVPTRFPHHSHLYRTLASKEWCASICLMPQMKCPLTTKVTRSMMMQHGYKNVGLTSIRMMLQYE